MVNNLELAKQAALAAGMEILKHYNNGGYAINTKHDDSPVTDADYAAHRVIEHQLKETGLPLLSEEGEIPGYDIRQQWSRYWLVDPLDGTKGFINKTGEFAVNIALIENQRAVLGVVYVPIRDDLYFATEGQGAFLQKGNDIQAIHGKEPSADGLALLSSRVKNSRRMTLLRDILPGETWLKANSAMKFGMLAAGMADIYPRFGPTSEWDTAAGHCIVNETGGAIFDFNLKELRYNAKPDLENPPFLVVAHHKAPWKDYLAEFQAAWNVQRGK